MINSPIRQTAVPWSLPLQARPRSVKARHSRPLSGARPNVYRRPAALPTFAPIPRLRPTAARDEERSLRSQSTCDYSASQERYGRHLDNDPSGVVDRRARPRQILEFYVAFRNKLISSRRLTWCAVRVKLL